MKIIFVSFKRLAINSAISYIYRKPLKRYNSKLYDYFKASFDWEKYCNTLTTFGLM